MHILDAARTHALLPMPQLMDAVAVALGEYFAGTIESPLRTALPMQSGGLMLSMPAVGADIAIHKLANVARGNPALGLPTIHGLVVACHGGTGQLLFALDGPTVTARRTAAISLLGMKHLLPHGPSRILLIGTGKQAAAHVEAIAEIFPDCVLRVRGTTAARTRAFIERLLHAGLDPDLDLAVDEAGFAQEADTVLALTTSKQPVWSEPARPLRLVIGGGAFTADAAELAPPALAHSTVYVDDPEGARDEAGDLLAAAIDWAEVLPLAAALQTRPDFSRQIVLKSVGCAAWDLAACRVARRLLPKT